MPSNARGSWGQSARVATVRNGGCLQCRLLRSLLDTEADEAEDDGKHRIDDVEERVRQVLYRWDTEHPAHVSPAAVPRHERRGHGASVIDGARQHAGREAASCKLRSKGSAWD